MRVTPWIELGVTVVRLIQVAVALTIPYLAKVFSDDFPIDSKATWLR